MVAVTLAFLNFCAVPVGRAEDRGLRPRYRARSRQKAGNGERKARRASVYAIRLRRGFGAETVLVNCKEAVEIHAVAALYEQGCPN